MEFTAEQLPDTLVVEHEGKQIPMREHPFVREAPDLPTLVKQGFDAHREVGARIRIPGKDAKPEEVAAFKQKAFESGVFAAPPASPEDYKIAKPEGLPDGILWSEELSKKLATTLHKYGIPVAAAPELLALHQEALMGVQASLGTSFDKGMEELKKEHGDKFEERAALAGRMLPLIFKTPEEMAFAENMGLADHPGFLSLVMRLAPLAMQDSSFIAEMDKAAGSGGGEMKGEDVRAEVAKIMTDKTHPMHEGYLKRDPKVQEHIDGLYKKAYGDGKVELV